MTGPARRKSREAVRRERAEGTAAGGRVADYRRLKNPFTPLVVLSDDRVEYLHRCALRILREIGIKVLLPEARSLLAEAGADVDERSEMVRLNDELVEQALAAAPGRIELVPAASAPELSIGGNELVFATVGGPPHITDSDSGKRPGTQADFENLLRLAQTYDVIHMLGPCVEPQDVSPAYRHLEMTLAQLVLTDKFPFVYSRGTRQVADCFEMLKMARGLGPAQFEQQVRCYTVINTNSPLQLDSPMLQGLLDFARSKQLSIITPFTLAGAMTPITLAGALAQQHAEALAGIVVAQIARPGAPVAYGCFTSNVDMKSGAPAFGTPEYVKAAIASGQLARHIGIPWRSSNVNASNAPDAQAVYESQMSLWGALMGGCNIVMHGAGWLEGGLSASMEKFILDVEMLQMFAEIFMPVSASASDIAFDTIKEVGPGGHFFAASHTMERYRGAFYSPLVSDWSNFGQWTEQGAKTATQRARDIYKQALADFAQPATGKAKEAELREFVARRKAEGGANPDS